MLVKLYAIYTLLPAVVGFMQVSETYSRQVFKAAEA